MAKFRWTKDGGANWTVVEASLPYNISGVTIIDTVIVEPIGDAVTEIDIAAIVEWWDFRTGGTGAAITSHAGKKGVYTLSQSNASYKPIWNASGYCAWDATDDYLEFTVTSAIAAGQLWVETPYGWYKSGIGNFAATTHRLALPDATQVILVDTAALSGADDTALTAYMSGTQYGFIGKTNDLTIYNRIDNTPDVNYTIEYFGANAATYSLASLQAGATIDISAQGLTAPTHMRWPIGVASDSTLASFQCYGNQLTGNIPSLATNTSLVTFQCYTNKLTGNIPSLAANTSLVTFYCNDNKLTGNIPSLATNTSLVNFFCNTNQLTGNIPSLAANTSLVNFYCNDNKLTGWDGGTVSNTISIFRADSNALSETAVNGLLVAFDTAGRASGTLNLHGGTNAAPTGAGSTAKASLQAKGWTVTTN